MEKAVWNQHVDHPLQAWEWGKFREATGAVVVREAGMQITIHKVPHTRWTVGYYPKGSAPSRDQVEILKKIARDNNCIFIKCEPKVESSKQQTVNSRQLKLMGYVQGRSLFTKYNFVLDVTPNEEELLASFKQKTRYNIRIAQKRGVVVELSGRPEDFERYLELTTETTARQGFYAHTPRYHSTMWSILGKSEIQNTKPQTKLKIENNKLTAHLLVARYQDQVISTWILFRFKDTLYYPYGASTREHREVMANNLVMWEAIRLAKKWGLKYLDMWGSLGPDPDKNDPWFGFHNFKMGYNPRMATYIGSWDYVAKPGLYKIYRLAETVRWFVLRNLRRQ